MKIKITKYPRQAAVLRSIFPKLAITRSRCTPALDYKFLSRLLLAPLQLARYDAATDLARQAYDLDRNTNAATFKARPLSHSLANPLKQFFAANTASLHIFQRAKASAFFNASRAASKGHP